MKTFKTLALAAAVSAGLLSSAGVMAARQGELGTSSDGDFEITYNLNPQVRIWGLEDMSFNGDLGSAQFDSFDFCTFSNNTEEVLITVDSANGDFALNSTPGVSGGPIGYELKITDKDDTDQSDTWGGTGNLGNGQQGYSQYSASMTPGVTNDTVACTGTGYSLNTLRVDIPAVTSGAPTAAGDYSDTVTLTISAI